MEKIVNIITVNYNSSQATIKMLESLSDHSEYIDQIVVVDNSSSEEDILHIKNWIENNGDNFHKLELEILDDNYGYFKGLNAGLNKIMDKKNLFNIVCNNDLIFNREFFERLGKIKFNKSVYVICPSVKTIDGCYQNPSLEKGLSHFKKFFYLLYYSNYYLGIALLKVWRSLGLGADGRKVKDQNEKIILIGIGAIFILTERFFSHNSFLFAPTFLYGEEAFLSKQVHLSGGVQLYFPQIEVFHLESFSTKKLPGRFKYNLTRKSFRLYREFLFKS